MRKCLLLLLFFPLLISSLTFYYCFQENDTSSVFGVYSLISAVLFTLFPILFCLYYYYIQKKYGFFMCQFNCFLICLLSCILTWSCVTLGIFYSSVSQFPSPSGYGGFTIIYLIIFSLMIFVAAGLLLLRLEKATSRYIAVILGMATPLVCIALGLFLGTEGVFDRYSFFSYNMLAGICVTLFAFLMGAFVHRITHDFINERKQIDRILILQICGRIGFPLIPASVVFNFALLLVRENLFEGETYTFACLAVTNAFLLGVASISGITLHNIFDLMETHFSPDQVFYGTSIYILPNLFTSIFQFFILLSYYLLSQDNLPDVANIGGYCAIGLTYLNINLRLILICYIRKLDHQPSVFKSKVRILGLIQVLILFLGYLCGISLLGFVQSESNLFFEFPHFSLFMLLSLFYFLHSFYAVLPFETGKLEGLAQNLEWNINQPFVGAEEGSLEELAPVEEIIDCESLLESLEEENVDEALLDEKCAICLSGLYRGTFVEETWGNKEVSRIKKCGHCFHKGCISDWLTSHRTCPIDRRQA